MYLYTNDGSVSLLAEEWCHFLRYLGRIHFGLLIIPMFLFRYVPLNIVRSPTTDFKILPAINAVGILFPLRACTNSGNCSLYSDLYFWIRLADTFPLMIAYILSAFLPKVETNYKSRTITASATVLHSSACRAGIRMHNVRTNCIYCVIMHSAVLYTHARSFITTAHTHIYTTVVRNTLPLICTRVQINARYTRIVQNKDRCLWKATVAKIPKSERSVI